MSYHSKPSSASSYAHKPSTDKLVSFYQNLLPKQAIDAIQSYQPKGDFTQAKQFVQLYCYFNNEEKIEALKERLVTQQSIQKSGTNTTVVRQSVATKNKAHTQTVGDKRLETLKARNASSSKSFYQGLIKLCDDVLTLRKNAKENLKSNLNNLIDESNMLIESPYLAFESQASISSKVLKISQLELKTQQSSDIKSTLIDNYINALESSLYPEKFKQELLYLKQNLVITKDNIYRQEAELGLSHEKSQEISRLIEMVTKAFSVADEKDIKDVSNDEQSNVSSMRTQSPDSMSAIALGDSEALNSSEESFIDSSESSDESVSDIKPLEQTISHTFLAPHRFKDKAQVEIAKNEIENPYKDKKFPEQPLIFKEQSKQSYLRSVDSNGEITANNRIFFNSIRHSNGIISDSEIKPKPDETTFSLN